MGLFSRRRSGDSARREEARGQATAIDAFWSWWAVSGARDVASAIEEGRSDEVPALLADRLGAVHPDLAWELSPGRGGSRHLLVVTPEGEDALRAVARRWRLAAPADDGAWSFADARQPMPDLGFRLEFDGVAVDAETAQVAARVEGPRVHVTVHHPTFGELTEQTRSAAAFLLLDAVLGETDVETWVGAVSASPVAPMDAFPLGGLPDVVDHLRAEHTDRDGNPTWALLEGTAADGSSVIAGAQVPLEAVTAPHFDTHVAVLVPYTDRDERGFPGPDTFPGLIALEDHLSDRLGGSGRLVAHQMHNGTRVLHYYVDGATPAAEQLRASVGGWEQGRVQVEATYDPAWEAVAHLRQ